jgi:hypothetical protein
MRPRLSVGRAKQPPQAAWLPLTLTYLRMANDVHWELSPGPRLLQRRWSGGSAVFQQALPSPACINHGRTFKFGETGCVWGQQQTYEIITTSLTNAVLPLRHESQENPYFG